MAIVTKYYLRLNDRDQWEESRDGIAYTAVREDSVKLDTSAETTHVELWLDNRSGVAIRLRLSAVGHDRHGGSHTLEASSAARDSWDIQALPIGGSLTWTIDGDYLGEPEAPATARGATARLAVRPIHDPTFKIEKGGGG